MDLYLQAVFLFLLYKFKFSECLLRCILSCTAYLSEQRPTFIEELEFWDMNWMAGWLLVSSALGTSVIAF